MSFPLREASVSFFERHAGTVTDVALEPLEPEHDTGEAELGATVTVSFDNAALLGDDRADIYDDVYPRYRALRDAWWRALASVDSDEPTRLRPYLLPLPAPGAPLGQPLAPRESTTGDISVVPIESVPRTSRLDRLRREYSLEYGIRGSSGRMFDLPEAMLLAVRSATDALPDLSAFVELGAGTGAAAHLALRRARPKRLVVHDQSPVAARHLRDYLGAAAGEVGTSLEVLTGDCRELPFAEPISLLALSIPFAQQPSLLARRGPEIQTALGQDGVLLAASSMVGMRFYQALVDGEDERVAAWPWYVPGQALRDLFTAGATVRVHNLVISVASNAAQRVDATVAGMVARGAELLA
jgi:hypothetical protein